MHVYMQLDGVLVIFKQIYYSATCFRNTFSKNIVKYVCLGGHMYTREMLIGHVLFVLILIFVVIGFPYINII